MDCRRTLGLGVCFLIGALGCTRHEASLPVLPPAAAKESAEGPVTTLPPGAVVKKEAELPKRMPKPSTCVAYGDFQASEARSPDLPETVRQEKREQARHLYEQALTLDPHCLAAYLSLAQLYADMKDHAHAEEAYHKAAQMFPNEARVYFEMGRCYGSEKEWDRSIQALTRAVELDPENRPYIDALGWTEARAGRFDESLATFRKIYDEPEAHYHLAEMLDYLGQADLCREHLRLALTKDPRMDKAKTMLAKLDAAPANNGVQPAAYVTAAKAEAPAVPTPAPTPAPVAKGFMLPPPPHIPIRYADAPAPEAAPVPPLPGPGGPADNTDPGNSEMK